MSFTCLHFSSGWRPLFFANRNHFSNFGRRSPKKQFCDLNYFEIGPLAYEDMSFKSSSIFSSGGHFVERSGTILAILIEAHSRNKPMKLFWKRSMT